MYWLTCAAMGLTLPSRASIHADMADPRQCDYAGVVEEVGPGVTKPLKKGDRVCGFAHGG